MNRALIITRGTLSLIRSFSQKGGLSKEPKSPLREPYPPKKLSRQSHAMLDRMLRVDHAGEYGANRIYAGQYAVLGRTEVGPLIKVWY